MLHGCASTEDTASRLRSLRDDLASFEPGVHSAESCARLAEEFAATAKACEAAAVRAIARAAKSGEHRTRGHADAVDWAAAVAGSTTGAARDALRTVATVDDCPDTRDALLAGAVSLSQAAEIVKTEAEVPGSEHELLELARSSSSGVVRERARKRRLAAVPVDDLYAKQRAARCFRHSRNDLGNVVFRGELTPEVGVAFAKRLDAETKRVHRQARREGSTDSWEMHSADAFARLVTGQGAAKATAPDVILTIDWRTFVTGELSEGGRSEVVGGGPIPPAVVRAMAGDAFVKAVLHDGVEIHKVLHLGRHIPAEIATALRLGAPPDFDGAVCSDDGCGRRHHLEIDHIDPVANGGATCIDNLELKCWPHHRAKTEADRHDGKLGGRPCPSEGHGDGDGKEDERGPP
ncbi:MAG: HNH endonuclease [Acidimicrobiia bacterium]